MTTSILNDALLLRNEPLDKLQAYLSSINLTLFDDLIEKDRETAKQNILYILCAYSEDSPMIILRQDTKVEQEGICEYLNIPEFRRKDLINLKDATTRIAVSEYVKQFAGATFRSLAFSKIQMSDLEIAVTERQYYTTKEEVVTGDDLNKKTTIQFLMDWKEQGKATDQINKLARVIERAEKELKDRIKRQDGIDDLKEFSRLGKESGKIKAQRTGRVENVIS